MCFSSLPWRACNYILNFMWKMGCIILKCVNKGENNWEEICQLSSGLRGDNFGLVYNCPLDFKILLCFKGPKYGIQQSEKVWLDAWPTDELACLSWRQLCLFYYNKAPRNANGRFNFHKGKDGPLLGNNFHLLCIRMRFTDAWWKLNSWESPAKKWL